MTYRMERDIREWKEGEAKRVIAAAIELFGARPVTVYLCGKFVATTAGKTGIYKIGDDGKPRRAEE